MMAAILAARAGNDVTIIDGNDQVGRKLLVTGAGRCNLTNANVHPDKYASGNVGWLDEALKQFSLVQLLDFLSYIGVPSYATDDGWYYPVSELAHAVADAFDAAMERSGVRKLLKKKVTGIENLNDGFNVMLHRDALNVDRVVIACGGKAYPALGSDGSLLEAVQVLGHHMQPLLPALAPLTADMRSFREIQGVRLDAGVKLMQQGKLVDSTVGNIIFTQWGVNGPGVMDISHHVSKNPGSALVLELDLLHGYSDQVRSTMLDDKNKEMPVRVALQSVLPPKMAGFIVNKWAIKEETKLGSLSKEKLEEIFQSATHMQLKVTGTRGFEFCQVSSGGVPLEEVNPETMESLVVPGLFLAGEILDVTGPCGGYNLHFAFTTGAIAGANAGK